jgi:ABC-type multidrug transport system fused ATPase/permease subunit
MKSLSFKEFFNIFKHVKPNKFTYFFVLACDCITEISFYLLTPIVMKLMIDAAVKSDMKMLKNGLFQTLAVSLSGMVLFVIVEFFLLRSYDVTTASIRNKLFRVILRLPISYVEQTHSGDTVSRLTNDIETMKNAYSWEFRMILVTLLGGLGSALVMFLLDWKVSILLISIGLISVVININQVKELKQINSQIQKNTGKYTENISNIISGFMTIKSIRLEKLMSENTHKINNDLFENSIILSKKSAFIEARNFLFSSINFLGVIILASFLALRGISSLGSVVSMVYLLGSVNRMFGEINNMLVKLQGFVAGSDRVMELMETQVEPNKIDVEAVSGSDAAIDLKDIVFSYDGVNNVLEGVDLTVKRGHVAALAGPSGGGKSTIIKLIMGFYIPSSGQMTVGGKPLKDMAMTELRSLIAYVPQDAYIFDGTIEENIRYGKLDATKQEIITAAKAAYADEFIQEMENRYETLVGERGIKLSGGQKQRIAVARAFLKDAPILLLDEATSSLDSQSEQHVQEALYTLMKNRTTLIIAHRLSTIEHADVIYIVDNGRIIEQGSHNDLVLNGSLYPKLHSLQFE